MNINFINRIDKVKKAFGKIDKNILPVLTCYSYDQFMVNIDNLYKYFKQNKIAGIFILNTCIKNSIFKKVYRDAKDKYPDFWIGVNILGVPLSDLLEFIENYNPDGVWVDDSYLHDINDLEICEVISNHFEKINWNGLYFGGVMFKYSQYCNEYNPDILKVAYKYMDVLTTSGDGTGIEIKEKKLDFISENSENICISVASGINSKNIKKISEKSHMFIVRTSIVDSDNNIDNQKLDELISSLNN
jgi:hypothetical protein